MRRELAAKVLSSRQPQSELGNTVRLQWNQRPKRYPFHETVNIREQVPVVTRKFS
jgi:hypothetical protein